MENLQLNTVLIGLGRIGWQLEYDKKRYHPCTHAGTIKTLSHQFRLIGICDKNQKKIDSFMKWWNSDTENDIIYHTNYNELLKNIKDNIDFVVIATGPDSHWEIIQQVLQYSVKTILIEKPIAYTTSQLEFITEYLKSNSVFLYVNFERRYHPAYTLVKKIINKKTLGKLLTIQGKIFAKSIKRDVLLEDGIHCIDLILWYIGLPEILYSYWELKENLIEKRSFHVLKKEDVVIHLESGERDYFEFFMIFDFEKGSIEIGNQGIKIYRKVPSPRYERFFELKQCCIKIPFRNPWTEMYQYIYQNLPSNFSDALKGIFLYERLKKFCIK